MDYNNHIMRSYVFIQHANPIASIPMNALRIIGFTISMPHIPPNRTTSQPVMDNAIRMGIKPPTANERNNEVAARHGFASLTPAARSASRCAAMLEYSPPSHNERTCNQCTQTRCQQCGWHNRCHSNKQTGNAYNVIIRGENCRT